MANIIIDLEFNGLFRYDFVPEINQIKVMNVQNRKRFCMNFKTNNEGYLRGFYGTILGDELFSKEKFLYCLSEVGAKMTDDFYGFSIETDEKLLYLYGIEIEKYHDLSWLLRKTKYEKLMAYGGSSLEACYYMITGNVSSVSHDGIEEIELIYRIYNEVKKCYTRKHLTIYPFGDLAGMPLSDFVESYRKRADGYRYNNCNDLSEALDFYIEKHYEDCL